jgi:hypothetical protein
MHDVPCSDVLFLRIFPLPTYPHPHPVASAVTCTLYHFHSIMEYLYVASSTSGMSTKFQLVMIQLDKFLDQQGKVLEKSATCIFTSYRALFAHRYFAFILMGTTKRSPALPWDVLLEILAQLIGKKGIYESKKWLRDTMAACALVSRSFWSLSRSVLFCSVIYKNL